jgi:hypothetical protein
MIVNYVSFQSSFLDGRMESSSIRASGFDGELIDCVVNLYGRWRNSSERGLKKAIDGIWGSGFDFLF